MNLATTESHRPQAAKKLTSRTSDPSLWNFTEWATLLDKPSIYSLGLRKLCLAMLEETAREVIQLRECGSMRIFEWYDRHTTQHRRDLDEWITGADPDQPLSLDTCCHVLDLDVSKIRSGFRAALGAPRTNELSVRGRGALRRAGSMR